MLSSPLLALALLHAAAPAAGTEQYCSRETLVVRGAPVTIAYCISGQPAAEPGGELGLDVNGTYSSGSGSYARRSVMRFVASGPSHVLQNIDLAELGLQGTLHVTLVYEGGLVRIESAMLTPGAVTIK